MKWSIAAKLLLVLLANSISLNAQTISGDLASKLEISSAGFHRFHGIDDGVFSTEVTKTAPGSDVATALEAQSMYFLERFQDATKGQFEKGVAKSSELNRKRREAATILQKSPRVYGKSVGIDELIGAIDPIRDVESENPVLWSDGLQTVNVETENGIKTTASEQKSIDTPEMTASRDQTGASEVSYDGKNTMTKSISTEEKVDAVLKADGRKVTKISKISFGASLELCPDFAGLIRGTGTTRIYYQTTINTGKQLAALTTEYTVDFRVNAYVNDDAEMTHFDLKATVIEKKLGFDRAVRLGVVDSANGHTDGTSSVFISFDGNTPPSSTISEYGTEQSVLPKLGKETTKPLPTNTPADNERLIKAGGLAVGNFIIDMDQMMRSSSSSIRNYECVSVVCTSPRTVLAPNETIAINAVTISSVDKSKVPAKLTGSGTENVSPGEQKGTPSVTYSLTAPDKGKATLIVKSVSRRGIGLEVLEIPVQDSKKKTPVNRTPVKPKLCDQGWTGTVKAVRTYRKNEHGKADGRLVRQVVDTTSNYAVDISLPGTRDTTGGIVNNFHGNARASYTKEEQRERNYAAGKMSCDKQIITSPQTQKNILNYVGDSSGQVLVAVAVIGNRGHIDFTPPPLSAAFTNASIYETACPSYDRVNTSTSRSDNLIAITQSGFEVDFEVDPSKPNVISGSKTVQESDGSETTYTWELSRCQ